MDYQIIRADSIPTRSRRKVIDWPLEQLGVGDAFVVPMSNGRDKDGRCLSSIRVTANRFGQRLGCAFSVNVIDGGVKVSRTA